MFVHGGGVGSLRGVRLRDAEQRRNHARGHLHVCGHLHLCGRLHVCGHVSRRPTPATCMCMCTTSRGSGRSRLSGFAPQDTPAGKTRGHARRARTSLAASDPLTRPPDSSPEMKPVGSHLEKEMALFRG